MSDLFYFVLLVVVKKYLQLCIFVPPLRQKTSYFAFTFQHLAYAFTTEERQQKEEYRYFQVVATLLIQL